MSSFVKDKKQHLTHLRVLVEFVLKLDKLKFIVCVLRSDSNSKIKYRESSKKFLTPEYKNYKLQTTHKLCGIVCDLNFIIVFCQLNDMLLLLKLKTFETCDQIFFCKSQHATNHDKWSVFVKLTHLWFKQKLNLSWWWCDKKRVEISWNDRMVTKMENDSITLK